jgi:putative endonuclease
MDTRPRVGRVGESATERLYVARGFRVVARNWRCGIGELDLILARGSLMVVCEVKTRRSSRFGGGFEAVGDRKRHKVRAVTQVFLQDLRELPEAVRFDVASVRLRPDGSATIELFEDAF